MPITAPRGSGIHQGRRIREKKEIFHDPEELFLLPGFHRCCDPAEHAGCTLSREKVPAFEKYPPRLG